MKILYLILINITLLALNIPFGGLNSIMGYVMSFTLFGSIFVLVQFMVLLFSLFRKNRNSRLIITNLISLAFLGIAFYWGILAFDEADKASFESISIWYKIGPSLSFTVAILIHLNTWYYTKFLKNSLNPVEI